MSDHDPLIDLLALWEEKRQQGVEATAEELCPGDMALQSRLRQRIQRRRKLLEQIDFPTLIADQGERLAPAVPQLKGYEFHEMLGSGGMGVVYKARQLGLNRIVAVKMVLAGLGGSTNDLSRFHAEAKTVAQLHHPNIVQIHEIGEHDGRPYLALEYVEGGSLAQFLNGTPIAPQRAAELIRTLAQAVHYAHKQGIVHRDLKPANILLASDGTPKIADFGLAKRLDDEQGKTRTGTVLGTPHYMAPEQSLGLIKEIGPAADVYSLGVILYEMLTGRVPFRGPTFLDTLEQVRSQDPVPPSQLFPKIPKDLETICLKCLHKETSRRYASASELACDVQRFLDGEAIRARPATVFEEISRALVRTKHDFPQYATWSRWYLAVAPFPALIHLALMFFFQHEGYFPLLAVAVSIATAVILQRILLRGIRAGLRSLPASLRRQTYIVWTANSVGDLVVFFGVWWHCPADQPERLLLVYPFMVIMVGMAFFSFAAEFGYFFVTGALAFLSAFVMFLFPPWSPLIVGVLMTFNVGSFGVFFRWLAAEAKKAETTQNHESHELHE